MKCKYCGGTNLLPDLRGDFYDATGKRGEPYFCDDCHPGNPKEKSLKTLENWCKKPNCTWNEDHSICTSGKRCKWLLK